LFHGTVFQNVANGMSDFQLGLPEKERRQLVSEACIASNAHGFIEQLQNVSETVNRAMMLSLTI
jgi:ATP-binding cassette subfamily B (MDR/TAP) protein 1